jgi:LuxR family transcriptional regulator, maltose regulon positive regulatory protein
MPRDDLLLHTKLAPPRLRKRGKTRSTLIARLLEALDHRLTLVQAGTGYDKSTAFAALADEDVPLYWHSLDEADADPQCFLCAGGGAWAQVIDALVNALSAALAAPALLVIDDYQFIADFQINALVERFLTYLPPDLHVILTGRHMLNRPQLITWRAKSEVLENNRAELAFRADEIAALFHDTYAMQLSPDDTVVLTDKTEGWPILDPIGRHTPQRRAATYFQAEQNLEEAIYHWLAALSYRRSS